eukprot:gene6874-9415_t
MHLDLVLFLALSVVSTVMSGLVVLSGVLFSFMLSSTRPFSHIIFFISFCDMVASIGNLFGFPNNGSFLCTLQGIILQFFFPASWFFTAALVYQIYCMVIYHKLWLNLYAIHGICWTLSLIITLLPLSTNNYGNVTEFNKDSPCHYSGPNNESANQWFNITYAYLPIIIILFMFICGSLLLLNQTSIKSNGIARKQKMIIQTSMFYPLGLIITWFPLGIYSIITTLANETFSLAIGNAFTLLTTSFGILIGLIFFCNSPRARLHWKNLLFGNYIKYIENDDVVFDDEEDILCDELPNDGSSFSSRGTSQTIFRNSLMIDSTISTPLRQTLVT